MTLLELEQQATLLEHQIEKASEAERLRLQPHFSRVIATLTSKGGNVPQKLRRLDRSLEDEAFEAMFDNLPV